MIVPTSSEGDRMRPIASVVVAFVAVIAVGLSLWLTAAPAAAQEPCGDTYIVQQGDTLRDIAAQCDTTVQAILELNPGITNRDRIYVNQVIDIPQPGETPPPEQPGEPSQFIYIVRSGDWLLRIARRFDVSLSALLQANPQLETPNTIVPGQRLVIPLQPDQATVSIAPPSGPPGTPVRVEGSGFPPGATVEVLQGLTVEDANVVNTVEATDAGTVSTAIGIPEDADPAERHIVILRNPDTGARAISNEFRVTGDDLVSRVNIYLIALEDAGESGLEIGCGDSVVPVEVEIEPTLAPLRAALSELLTLNEDFYGQSGLYNALAPSDLAIRDLDIDGGTATIALSGTFQIGGVCDEPRVQAQLRQTALQFATIENVVITINGTPLEDLLGGR